MQPLLEILENYVTINSLEVIFFFFNDSCKAFWETIVQLPIA